MRNAPPLDLEEQANVRRAIGYLYGRLGTWIAVARAVRIKRATVRRVRDGGWVRPYVAGKVAMVAAIPVEDLKAGKYPSAGACPRCGHLSSG